MPRLIKIGSFLLILVIGLSLVHWGILQDSFAKLHGDLGDSRFVLLLLEHNFQYFFGSSEHFWQTSWNFFPFENALALSELMTGATLVYAPIRFFTSEMEHAYQLWHLACSTLNFLSFFILLGLFRLNHLPKLAGAFLFAFAMPRNGFLAHPQLLPNFYIVFFTISILRLVSAQDRAKKYMWSVLTALCLALQFWTAYYPGWFTVLLLLLTVCVYGVHHRSQLVKLFKENWRYAALSASLFIVSIAPLFARYLKVLSQQGPRSLGEVASLLPKWQALFLGVPHSLFYAQLTTSVIPKMRLFSEMFMFNGMVPLIFIFISAIPYLRQRLLKNLTGDLRTTLTVCSIVVLLTYALVIKWPNGLSLWRVVYWTIPGASVIRAAGRISLQLLLPIGVVVASMSQWADDRFSRRLFLPSFAILIFIFLENFNTNVYAYNISEHKERIDKIIAKLGTQTDCRYFYDKHAYEDLRILIDCSFASLKTGIATINGYSGSVPKDYEKDFGLQMSPAVSVSQIQAWLLAHGVEAKATDICIIDSST